MTCERHREWGQARKGSVWGEWTWQIKSMVRNVSEGVNARHDPGAAEENAASAPGTGGMGA